MPVDNKLSHFNSNLQYLRTKRNCSIQEMAKTLGLKNRSTYYSWERGESQPNIAMLLKIANEFEISLDELLRTDLSKSFADPQHNVYEVEIVPLKAVAGYSSSYADPEWCRDNIKKISIPFQPPVGTVRAFPIEGDSMEPKVSEGSYVVAVRVEDPRNEVIEGKDYIVVTRDNGIMYKFLFRKDSGVQLVSSNRKHPPIELINEDIQELWKFFCLIEHGGK